MIESMEVARGGSLLLAHLGLEVARGRAYTHLQTCLTLESPELSNGRYKAG